MLKQLFVGLFLFVSSVCFSSEDFGFEQWKIKSMLLTGRASTYLVAHQPFRALEDLERVSALIDRTDEDAALFDFLISFEKIVAYDCLGWHEPCRQAIGEMFLAVYAMEDDDDIEVDVEHQSSRAGEWIGNIFYSVVSLVPSPEVRQLLYSVVDDMVEGFSMTDEELDDLAKFLYEEWSDFEN